MEYSHEEYGKVLQVVGEKIDKYAIPIFIVDQSKRPEIVGTGFFINYIDCIYFVTASHVIDELNDAGSLLKIALGGGIFSLELIGLKRTISTEKGIADNHFDIAVLPISKDHGLYSRCLQQAIPIYSSMLDKKFPTVDMQILQGYPVSKNKTTSRFNRVTNDYSSALWTYSFMFDDCCDFESLGKSPDYHYAVKWLGKVNGQKIPNPRGCSGGPYWFVPDIENVDNQILAGVFIEYWSKHSVAFVTKIEHVVKLIECDYV
ncbi:hypothetical protein [Photobacterium andalusiense]|uniref:Trypsin n=1 Tax=Photobacterium andalusiense TaxID=2204296 RepID=A0A1Y6MCQ8_9GAMM|nr:hypothetical protein [Photobacterium andalusiense]SMY34334.1 hypothetical protein PAND9192_01276 [Photobacterium andalusiense]